MKYEITQGPCASYPRLKTLNQKVCVDDHSLQTGIFESFGLAKSAGQELNVVFLAGSRPPAKRRVGLAKGATPER